MKELISDNVLLSKYKQQAIAEASNEKDVLAVLSTAWRKTWIYQLFLFIVISGHGKVILS